MRSPPRLLPAVVVAVLGFASSAACIPGPLRPGITARREVAPPPPAHGPWRQSGGQRIAAAVPADAPAVARAALTAAGWTVHPSARADEVIGTRHDNRAYVRWSVRGWWVRVDQVSDFATGERVPPWDHPWEALRLLHRLAPGAGPAEGWRALDPPPPQLVGAEAEALYRDLLRDWLTGRLDAGDSRLRRLRDHLQADPDPAAVRERLAMLVRLLRPGEARPRWRSGPAALAPTPPMDWADRRIDPYTTLPLDVVIRPPSSGREAPPHTRPIDAERVIARLAVAAGGDRSALYGWWRSELAELAALAPPEAVRFAEVLAGERPWFDPEVLVSWWDSAGHEWVAHLAAEGR